jgi:hypothetical protein
MSEDLKPDVDAKSAEFKEGVEAGLNSEADTRNWKAGNELGQELKGEVAPGQPIYENPFKETVTPLFMRDYPEGKQGNAQDEKDAMEE